MNWADTEAIALALHEAHPEAPPLDVPPDTLRAWVAALPELHHAGDAPDREDVRAIQMLWYELAEADESDVSG